MNDDDDKLMSVQELAAYLDVPERTIYAWRHQGKGPVGMRVGRFVRWRHRDVDSWLEEQRDPQQASA